MCVGSSPTGGTYLEAAVAETIWSIIAVVGGFAMVGGVLYFMLTERGDREREEAARVYFDEHGYWPDEAPPGDGAVPRV
jgi:hypothetical protein